MFAATILLGAALMFWIELLVGRLVLPALGGSAAVWNTCLFFFQAVLLAGYGYAHVASRLAPRVAVALHAVLLSAPWLVLPLALPDAWSPDPRQPITELLGWLIIAPGLPLLVVASGAPLLQSWYARLGQSDSGDPYWLYAASNLGSLIGLLGYPFVIEPLLGLGRQASLWSMGFGGLVLFTLACGVAFGRSGDASGGTVEAPQPRRPGFGDTAVEDSGEDLPRAPASSESAPSDASAGEPAPDVLTIARWVVLSFVPGCLLYGVTTALTTDVAPVPLLWVVPLALYLLSFVVAFGPGARLPRNPIACVLTILGGLMIVTRVVSFAELLWTVLSLHLIGFFGFAVVLHGDLARTRPDPRHLTGYYLWIAVGGALAGAYCGLIAPLVFPELLEYSWSLLLALILLPDARPAERGEKPSGAARLVVWGLLGIFGFLTPLLVYGFTTHDLSGSVLPVLTLLPVLVVCGLAWPSGRWRAVAALVLAIGCAQASFSGDLLLHRARSFYGLHRVIETPDSRVYVSGRVVHGRQPKALERRREPVSYYYRGGPIGAAVEVHTRNTRARVAVLGLGIGGLAAYATPRQTWRFYEIDPEVERIARNPDWFSYLADAPCTPEVVLGDARRSLELEANAGEAPWDLIVVDVFTSDSVPVHLLTVEALDLYLRRLAPGGLIAVNASNRYVELSPLFAALAKERGLAVRQRLAVVDAEGRKQGHSSTLCVALARTPADLGRLADDPAWKRLDGQRAVRAWTDDYADLLGLIRRP